MYFAFSIWFKTTGSPINIKVEIIDSKGLKNRILEGKYYSLPGLTASVIVLS